MKKVLSIKVIFCLTDSNSSSEVNTDAKASKSIL